MRENLKLVLDRVEKDGQLYEVTRLGKPVAIISPIPKKRLDKWCKVWYSVIVDESWISFYGADVTQLVEARGRLIQQCVSSSLTVCAIT